MTDKVKITDLKILGHSVAVFDVKNLARDFACYGTWTYADLAISIDQETHPAVKQETLCHELVESWNTLAELKLPHNKIQILGNCLFQFTADNNIYLFVPRESMWQKLGLSIKHQEEVDTSGK